MAADVDTMELIAHIDRKFEDADRRRAEAMGFVHQKIDAQTIQLTRIDTTLALHIKTTTDEFKKRDAAIEKTDDRKDNWMRSGATIVLGGGTLAAAWSWLKENVFK